MFDQEKYFGRASFQCAVVCIQISPSPAPPPPPCCAGWSPSPAGAGRMREKGTAVQKRSEPDPKSQKYRDRFYAAQELVVRAYCDFFEFWRACRYRPCRRARGCRGDFIDCMVARRAGESHRFDAARAHVRARIPKDAGAPERHAWMSDSCTVTWPLKKARS